MALTKKIDEIDAKILRDLLNDGRKKFTKIAEEAGVSKDIIWQHYKKMKKEGIIVGATILLDYKSYGYLFSASFFVNVESQKQDEIIERIQELPNIYPLAFRWGNNSEIWVIGDLESLAEMDYFKQRLKSLPSVIGLRTEVWTAHRRLLDNLSILHINQKLSKADGTDTRKSIRKTAGKIDETDKQIIEKLAANGRTSFRKIAKELKISTDTVSRRYKKLEEDGIIRVIIQINPSKLGYHADACFSLAFVSQESVSDTIQRITNIPDVYEIWKTSGIYDIIIMVKIRDIEQLITLQDKLGSTPGITRMETVVLKPFPLLPYPREHMSTF